MLAVIATTKLTHGRTIAEADRCRLLTEDARVRAQVGPCDICGGLSWHWDRFFLESFGFPLSL
jgi:hypothetical protein